MTAINAILRDDFAVILTDTRAKAAIGRDFDVPKVMPVPHLRLAIATRGPMPSLGKVVGAICSVAFDYESARAFLDSEYGKLGLDDTEIVVAGWGGEGPAACIVSAANTAGRVRDIEHVLITPVVDAETAEQFAADPIGKMMQLMQRQADNSSAVGGWINVCQVGPAVIETYTADVLSGPVFRAPVAV